MSQTVANLDHPRFNNMPCSRSGDAHVQVVAALASGEVRAL